MTLIPGVFVVGGDTNYSNWIIGGPVPRLSQAKLVLFCGGTDVNPSIYGKKPHSQTQEPDIKRDAYEKEVFEIALAMNLPMLGICRGAQFLCAMAGGILVQHSHHPSFHFIKTSDGRSIWSTSDHHQRMHPWGIEHKLLAWTEGLSKFNHGESFMDDLTQPDEREAEIVYFPQINALGIQSHPEWQYPANDQDNHNALIYHRGLLRNLLTRSL